MRVIIQRVSKASVTIDQKLYSMISSGLLVLAGFEPDDHEEDLEWLCRKILQMRIFGDDQGKMNLSVTDIQGEILLVSQFTLHASVKKGNRPSFIRSADPGKAEQLYLGFEGMLRREGIRVQTGVFGANMQVDLCNDGPVTLFIDSKRKE